MICTIALGVGFVAEAAALSRISEVLRHVLFILAIFSGGLPPFPGIMREDSPQLATLGAMLLWLFGMSSAMLGLSSIVAFQKMAHEAKGMGKLRLAFGAGICRGPVVWLIFMLLWLLLIGRFAI
ncbi:MAG: hypothetical protein WCA38_12590 [Candidatus Acidiferrales bacterium]